MSPDEAHLHHEVLPAGQRRVLERVGPAASARGSYLAGGTAVALHLGHRRSIDFDWFRPDPIEDPVALARDLELEGLEIRSTAPSTLHAGLDVVNLSFFAYRYALLETTVPARALGCELAALSDLAARKLAAVAQRGAKKDLFDIVAMGRAGMPLAAMLDHYRRKFAIGDVVHVLTALTWFDDAENEPAPACLDSTDWESVKATLRTWVREHVA